MASGDALPTTEHVARYCKPSRKSTAAFLHHCWCDVQMSDYSFQRLSEQMEIIDAAIDALEGMEVTDKMSRACRENMGGTSWNIWRAMVGAMRESK